MVTPRKKRTPSSAALKGIPKAQTPLGDDNAQAEQPIADLDSTAVISDSGNKDAPQNIEDAEEGALEEDTDSLKDAKKATDSNTDLEDLDEVAIGEKDGEFSKHPDDQTSPDDDIDSTDFEAQESKDSALDVVPTDAESQNSLSEDLDTEPDQFEDKAELVKGEDAQAMENGDSLVVAAEPKTSKVKRPSFLLRFLSWLISPFRRKSKQVSTPEIPEDIYDEQWAMSSIAELSKLQALKMSSADSAEKIQQQLSLLEQEQSRIETWLEGLKRSYYWKLEQQMESNLGQAKSDIAEYEGLVRALELPEKGTLRSLREKFHKGLIINLLTFAIPVFFLYFIPWFSKVDLFSWLVDVLRSPVFIVMVVTIGAVVGGLFLLLRRVLGAKKVTFKKSLKWSTISMLIPAVIYGLFRFKDFLLVSVTPVIEQIRPTALWVIAILFTFVTLAVLITYYQGWSVFRRVVTEEVSRLDNVVAGYVKTRQELGRLEFLYGQTIDWMRLLAHTLYRPWKVHPDWKSPNQAQAVSESFPMALRVAQAVENDASESAQLRRTIANRLLVQGWRTEAFEKSLSEIGRYLGYEPDKVNPELLDSDLPHQPNNARKLVLEYFEHSAATAHLGSLDLSNNPTDPENGQARPLPSDVYLVEVARDQLRYLIDKTQGSALAQSRPSVQQIVKNPLSELTESDTESESLEVSAWDEFLAEGLGIEDQTQPPIGVLAFTNEGRKAKSPDGVNSQVLVPGRFANSLPAPGAENLKVVPLEDNDQSQPAELMLRFDVVGPLPFSHVALIQNASTARIAAQAPQEENNDL